MPSDTIAAPTVRGDIRILLDGSPVTLPSDRRSLGGIRSYLETLALEQQRVLYSFDVDGVPANLGWQQRTPTSFAQVEGRTLDLDDLPLQFIRTALQQTADVQAEVVLAVSLVLINDGAVAREFWWSLAKQLKQPLLTLSLLPETLCGTSSGASVSKLRKWQLQQLGCIIREVDEACWSEDPIILSNALQNRVLGWLDNLQDTMTLLLETLLAGRRVACRGTW